jgi:hypothetical protein
MEKYEELIEAAEHELGLASQVTEQKGAAYYFNRAQVLAMLAMAEATAKGK